MNTRASISSRPEHGSVLIIVLVICLGLVSLSLVFGHSMMMSYRGEDNDLAGRQADAAIRGAEQYAETIIANATVGNTLPARSTYQASAVPLGEAFFWFIGVPLANDPTDKPTFALVDEASKLNLNSAGATSLALLPDMTPDFALAIRQWRTTTGTDTGGSIGFNTVKAAPYESPEELALVNGGTDPSVLYGDDANLNHVFDPEESNKATNGGSAVAIGGTSATPASSSGTGQFNPGLLEYVTVFSREPNTMSDGTKRGNVLNGVGRLRNVLTTALGNARAQEIVQRLQRVRNFRSVVDFCQQATQQASLTTDEWDKITPYLTMSDGTYQVGLVNANTASATVLSCLSGMTTALAQQMVAARPPPGDAAASNLAWIAPILGSQAGSVGRYLTTRSYQFSVDVAAVGRHGRGYRRTLFVLDTSTDPTGPPQIVYQRNLSNLGWALGSDARTALRDAAAKGGVQP